MKRNIMNNFDNTAKLAKEITKSGSKQTYYIAKLLVDKEFISDFFRAYAYFRWIDDIIDDESISRKECETFTKRQRGIIEGLYTGTTEKDLSLSIEETMLLHAVLNDSKKSNGLRSFIENMFAIIEFDAYRKYTTITSEKYNWYTKTLAQSVTDGLQYFIGNKITYPESNSRLSAALGSHIIHLLRDTFEDVATGFFNIPTDYCCKYNLDYNNLDLSACKDWVKSQVDIAKELFINGKKYIKTMNNKRCRIAALWYCARFEGVLNRIERDDYMLRKHYKERKSIKTYIKLIKVYLSQQIFN